MEENTDGISRRNFVKYASVSSTAMAAGVAGCTGGGGDGGGGDGGDGGGGGDGGDGGDGGGDGGGGDGGDGLNNGERPVQWIGPAWAVRQAQADKFTELTGNELEISNATNPDTQQRILSGGRETFDALALDTSSLGAVALDNDATRPIAVDDLDKWDPDSISEIFRNPGERVSHLGAQADWIHRLLWESQGEELLAAPHAYNFDALGLNPKFVDTSTELWSALYDDQYSGKVLADAINVIQVPQAMMHLLDTGQIDADIGELNNPTKDQIDTAVDFLVEEKQQGQFRSTWTAYGTSVNLMASEEAILGDLWQPAALDVRRSGTPCYYATMSDGIQGYRFWWGMIAATNPGSSSRNNVDEVNALVNDVHYGAWFPRFIQGWGYSVPHYPNTELVRDGSDESGQGMGPEYYDWAYRGTRTYESVENPHLFDPAEYDWSMEEGEPSDDGQVRNSGPIEERIDRIGFFQIWPDNADYLLERWSDFTSA